MTAFCCGDIKVSTWSRCGDLSVSEYVCVCKQEMRGQSPATAEGNSSPSRVKKETALAEKKTIFQSPWWRKHSVHTVALSEGDLIISLLLSTARSCEFSRRVTQKQGRQ